MTRGNQDRASDRAFSRRHLLAGGAAAGIGAAGAVGIDGVLRRAISAPPPAKSSTAPLNGTETIPFYGRRQSGIETVAQSHITAIGLDLAPTVDRDGLRRMMQILSDDAARLSSGTAALADSEPELALVPARLTITFGFGPNLVERAETGAKPAWLRPLPAFTVDQLESAWSGGDLLIQICSDDAVTVAHATRMVLKDSRSFASLRWLQKGFRRSPGSEKPGTTMRNLFGQIDGTANPAVGTDDFESTVWRNADNPHWLTDGTSVVIRRIAMNLDKWDELDRSGRESAIGRTLDTGAPLTGTRENDEPDFSAKNALGFAVIPEYSHLRRARSDNPKERIFRRGYNFDDHETNPASSNSGLLFVSFQADIDAQFVPIQKRMAELDLLNQWITPIGSAVFAIAPGCEKGGFIGETLF